MPASGRVVLRFDGTSVSTLASWETIVGVVESRLSAGERPVVVHAALAGVTSLLEEVVERALEGAHEPALDEVRERHERLAQAMGLVLPPRLDGRVDELRRLTQGIGLLGDASPAARARVLAQGPLMATDLAAEYMKSRGLPSRWVDARDVLTSAADPDDSGRGGPLAADCRPGPDPALQASWAEGRSVIVTQGRIARSPEGETVWLGRGGTDASAACIASRLDAARLELWGPVPGMFSADPRSVPSARLLKSLSYDEAQEIATTGSRVLHPRAIPAIRAQGIPIHVRSTTAPDLRGTVIAAARAEGPGRVKAISRKKGVTLVSMESLAMWQQAGFLARAFDVFRRWGLSVDLVSTSESMVTVSLDRVANELSDQVLDGLATDLGELCDVSIVEDAAALSLVGRQIRGMLYRLGPVLELFREEKIHLVSQAASDLNLTFVVDEEQADRLVARLHRLLIRPGERDPVFGPTWEALTATPSAPTAPPERWWERKRDRLLEVMETTDAAYVYDLEVVRRQAAALRSLRAVDRVLYSVKANPHPGILETIRDSGLAFECVSAAEIRHLESVFGDLRPDEVLFTPNFAPRDEYEYALARGVPVTLDALHPLRHWAGIFRDREVLLRVDPGRGEGHHEKVRTAGGGSKFGLIPRDLDEAGDRIAAAGGTVVGLHVHSGSGILDSDHWRRTGAFLTKLLPAFPEARVLDLGGGLGVSDTAAEPGLDLRALDDALDELAAVADVELWLEPGRFVVAEAGVLLARVTQVKAKEQVRYVGLATGMNSFIRPTLYGAYHEIRNLTRLGEPSTEVVTVVGPICETGDRFGTDRLLPEAREGEVLVVANTGAYGHSMSSRYNLRDPAEERVLR